MQKRLIEFIILGVFSLAAVLSLNADRAEAKTRTAQRAPASIQKAKDLPAIEQDWVSLTPSEAADLNRELDQRQRTDFDAKAPMSRQVIPTNFAQTASTN